MTPVITHIVLLAVFVLFAFGGVATGNYLFPSNNNTNWPQGGNGFLHMIGPDIHDDGNATNSNATATGGDKQQVQPQVLVKKVIRRRHVASFYNKKNPQILPFSSTVPAANGKQQSHYCWSGQEGQSSTKCGWVFVRVVSIFYQQIFPQQTNNNPTIAGVFSDIGTCHECCETYCVPTLLFPGGPKDGFSQGMHFCAQVRPGAIVSNTPYLLFFEFLAWAGFIAFCALALASGIGCCCGCYYCCSKAWECI